MRATLLRVLAVVWSSVVIAQASATESSSRTAVRTSLDVWESSVKNFQETASLYGSELRKFATSVGSSSLDDWVECTRKLPQTASAWWTENSKDHPLRFYTRLTAVAFVLYVWLLTKQKDIIKATGLSKDQQQDLIEDWEPEPLVPRAPKGTIPATVSPVTIESSKGRHVRVKGFGFDVLNCASCDFLGVSASNTSKAVSKDALHKYTLGSCGPRGFYGTTDAHLSLESELADLMGAPQSITYSDHTSTIASAVPAFSKRSDILVVDDGVNHAVQTGCTLSRSKIVTFRHNDMLNLEQVVQSFSKTKKDIRRFIVVEGVYASRGDVCPLPEVLRIARRYRFRVILDDSLGFGVLGKTGRGTAEHYGLEPLDVDVTLGSMATSLGSVGGFCVGNDEVVDHQRLSGAGYVFSASLPPFLCVTAEQAIRDMRSSPSLVAKLRSNASRLRSMLEESRKRFKITSSLPESPIIHMRLSWHSDLPANDPQRIEGGKNYRRKLAAEGSSASGDGSSGLAAAAAATPEEPKWPYAPARPRSPQRRFQSPEDTDLDNVVQEALERGVLISRSRYLVTDQFAPAPGIKVHVNAQMTPEDMERIVGVLEEAVEAAFKARAVVSSSPVRIPRPDLRRRA